MAKLLNIVIVCALLIVVAQFAKQERPPEYAIETIDISDGIKHTRIDYQVDLTGPKSTSVSKASFAKLSEDGPVFLNDKSMCAPKWFGLYQTYELTYFVVKGGMVHTTKVNLRDKFRSGQRGHKCTVWNDKIYVFVPK